MKISSKLKTLLSIFILSSIAFPKEGFLDKVNKFFEEINWEEVPFVTSIDRTTGYESVKTRGLYWQTIFGYSTLAPKDSDPYKELPRTGFDSFGFNVGSYWDLNEKDRLEFLFGFNAPLGFGVKASGYHFFNENFGVFAGGKISYLPDNLIDTGVDDYRATTTSVQLGYGIGAGKNWLLKLGYDFSYSFRESGNKQARSRIDGVFLETVVAFGK